MPISKALRISEPARRDLRRIGERSKREWGAAQKRKYLGHVRDTFRLLGENPAIGTPRDDIGAGLRAHPAGTHIIYYRESRTTVEIIRVLHGRMDPGRHLKHR